LSRREALPLIDEVFCFMEKEIWKDIPNYEGLYQVSNFGNIKSFHRNKDGKVKMYPNNTWFEIGTVDGTREWTNTSYYMGSQKVMIASSVVNAFLSNCSSDADGYCYVPVSAFSGTIGALNFSNITITTGTVNPNPVIVTATFIERYLNNSPSGFVNIPFSISSDIANNLTLTDVKYDYAGGNKSYKQTFTAKLLANSTADDVSLQQLALGNDVIIIASTNNREFFIYGAGNGLTAEAGSQNSGQTADSDTTDSITLSGQELTKPLRFAQATYQQTLDYLESFEI